MPDCAETSNMDKNSNDASSNSGRDSSEDKSPIPGSTSEDKEGAIDVRGGASGSRQRYDSEGASSSEDSSDMGKRQKTMQGFVIPDVPASPPKFVSLEEIMTATNGMNNMKLAHEIAVDKDFKLEKLEPPDNSIHKQVKDTMHKVFWDILEIELKEAPPNYTQAMVLLEDVKENLISLLLPQHTKLKEQIMEILDADLIRQQAEKGILDFQHYAQYVISVMGKLCAPVRDDKIKELTQTQDVVPMFKGILETLDLMKLDMANFTIDLIRPGIIAKSVEYEKAKFAEYLKIQTDGLQHTRRWLWQHLTKARMNGATANVDDKIAIRNLTTQILGEAYLELLEWDNNNSYPETLVMDQERFTYLGNKYWQLAVTGSVLLVTASIAQSLQGVAAFKDNLKDHTNVLLENIYSNKELEVIIPNVAEQVVKEVADGLEKYGFRPLDSSTEKLLKGQIVDIMKPEHKIRQLLCTRVKEFLEQTITSPTAAPLRVPPGLSSFQGELTAITGQFLRLVSHNRAVFGEYYTDIITEGISVPLPVTE